MSLNRLAYLSVLFVCGCGSPQMTIQPGGGGSKKDMAFHRGDGGGPDDGGTGDGGDDGGHMAQIDMAGFNTPGSPMVVITSPTAMTEVPNDVLTVTATITSPSSTVIQSSSVVLAITPPSGGIVSANMTLTSTTNVYTGTIDVSAIPSGPSTFSVSATDILGRKGSATGAYIHDHGPVITFLQPTAATAHGSVTVELQVEDTLHPVTDPTKVTAYIHSAGDIMLMAEPNTSPLRLQALVDFSKFSPPLDGPQIINATAVNPKGTTTHASKMFTVDNAGPTIDLKAPAAGSFVGGVVEIRADITDLSGVEDVSALAVFGNDPSHNAVPLTRTAPGSDTFHGFFDVRSLGRSYVFPELSITAADTLGNSSQLGVEIIVDNTPPLATMNSKQTVTISRLNNNVRECSQPFAPLGPNSSDPPEAAYDGAHVLQIVGLRARIEDRGNFAPGLLVERYSGLVPASVFLYAIPDDMNTPLAVDTDGDTNHLCDNVNPALIPSSSALTAGQALSLQLVPLAPGGGPDYTAGATNPDPAVCKQMGEASFVPPLPLCKQAGTGLTYVLPYNDPNVGNVAIFSIPPVTGKPDGCVGLQLDTNNRLPEGPACVVTVAVDQAGNSTVSAPLHICIDHGTPNVCAGWPMVTPPTTCTGRWDKTQMKIVPGTCTPELFPNNEIIFSDEF
jgi:hypothetical protein